MRQTATAPANADTCIWWSEKHKYIGQFTTGKAGKEHSKTGWWSEKHKYIGQFTTGKAGKEHSKTGEQNGELLFRWKNIAKRESKTGNWDSPVLLAIPFCYQDWLASSQIRVIPFCSYFLPFSSTKREISRIVAPIHPVLLTKRDIFP